MNARQIEALRAFTEAVLREAYEFEDGAWLQEKGEEIGVLVKISPTEPCSEEYCHCADYYSTDEFEDGETTCYRMAPFVTGKEDKS